MLDLIDPGMVDARRRSDLPLGIALLHRLMNQAISLGKKCFYAADFVPYPSEPGQRILACHSLSSTLRCAPRVAIAHPGYHRFFAQRLRIA
jgi:hypothetical protein